MTIRTKFYFLFLLVTLSCPSVLAADSSDFLPDQIRNQLEALDSVEPMIEECEQGVLQSCTFAALMYQSGINVSPSIDKALEYFQYECSNDVGFICAVIGDIYRQSEDYTQAAEYFTEACLLDPQWGCLELGFMYLFSLGVTLDPAAIVDAWGKACDAGDPSGCQYVTSLLFHGSAAEQFDIVTVDYEKARDFALKGCNLDNAFSCGIAAYLSMDSIPVEALEFARKGCRFDDEFSCTLVPEIEKLVPRN